ncbi:hypothetical protein [Pseudomonas cremoricolorata]|uniref:Uncharacterized protein n=1 Tax=Pseudomonas cremoricolorata TaxID=157783 RepID=A0A089YES3_9PSED|nr:hypothetical protein [Pseudomonas cremoricolorata]AIR90223.1 hypothetical protein LK03_13375 [Pseudomonas cremoricolorata]
MTKIRALRQFSHYHEGNFDQHEERPVDEATAEALVGMELAEYVDGPPSKDGEVTTKTSKKK